MHDHRKRGKRFCPMMKEWCNGGWTPSMGKDKDGEMPLLGACAAWQAVTCKDLQDPTKQEEIHDCAVYGWITDMLYELSKETYHTAASCDKVANVVSEQAAASSVMNAVLMAAKAEGEKRLLERTTAVKPAIEVQPRS